MSIDACRKHAECSSSSSELPTLNDSELQTPNGTLLSTSGLSSCRHLIGVELDGVGVDNRAGTGILLGEQELRRCR